MTAKVSFEKGNDGLVITKLTTFDKTIVVPEEVRGMPVRGIGPSFLSNSHGGNGRTLVIPACVSEMDPSALDGTTGIIRIEYGGELETFESFKLTNSTDCTVSCRNHGEDFTFEFISSRPMSFAEFDDSVLSLYVRLTPEIALSRLVNPVGLTDENRAKYERFISERIMPRAEQAISSGDTAGLEKLFSSGMISDGDLRKLLDRSLRSGRITVTSMLMSEIRRRDTEN